MHELGIAQGILDIVRQYVPGPRAAAVRAVTVRVGQMSGVVAESLDFCFGAITADTPYAQAFLAIDRVPARARCRGCDHEFVMRGPVFVCPACGGPRVDMTAGGELQVVEVELDETGAIAS